LLLPPFIAHFALTEELKGGIRVTTLEQLEVALMRAGSKALQLQVQWPVDRGTLELIGSRQYPICSIDIQTAPRHPLIMQRFKNLDIGSLNHIRIPTKNNREMQALMDLALESSCSKIALGMHGYTMDARSFEHMIMERVEHLELSCREYGRSSYMETLTSHE
jgi:hypothetical protein